MFRGHNNIICKSLRIFPFKKGPYKNVCNVIGFSGHQKNPKNMCREIKTIQKRFSMGYLTILIQIKMIYYQKMTAESIFGLRQASNT